MMNEEPKKLKPISIISSIGFDFFHVSNEKRLKSDLLNFSTPSLNRKGFSSILELKKNTFENN